MNVLYKVVKIDSIKGYGCVALKDIKRGTLILREKPQFCVDYKFNSGIFDLPEPERSEIGLGKSEFELIHPNFLNAMMKAFNKMSQRDQEDYLKLYNGFDDYQSLDEEMQQAVQMRTNQIRRTFRNKSAAELQEILDIFNIFRSNSDCCNQHGPEPDVSTMSTSLGIHSSRFNHSCHSNAERMVCTKLKRKEEKEPFPMAEDYEIRATSKIMAGEEITINYFWMLSVMKRESRQEYIDTGFQFSMDRTEQCKCQFCNEGKDSKNFLKMSEMFHEAFFRGESLRKMKFDPLAPQAYFHYSGMVLCYKQAYSIAKAGHCSPLGLYLILEHGYNAALKGIVSSLYNAELGRTYEIPQNIKDNYQMPRPHLILDENSFKKEAEMFAKAGKQMQKMFGFSYPDNGECRWWKEDVGHHITAKLLGTEKMWAVIRGGTSNKTPKKGGLSRHLETLMNMIA